MVQGEGFEPPKAEPEDLQSPVFDRFTIPANLLTVKSPVNSYSVEGTIQYRGRLDKAR